MANIDFPPGAINGTTHTQNGKTWVYDGTTWSLVVSSIPDASTIVSGLVNATTQTLGGNKSFANNLDIDGGLGVTGVAIFRSTLSILSNTNSTSSTSGALTVVGGVGISGNLTAGSGVSVGGTLRAGSGISVLGNITATGSLVLGSELATTSGGTGLNSIGTGNQVLGVNSGATGLEYKTVAAGSGISINHTANNIEIIALSGGSGTVNAGTGGSVAYYAANGSAVSGTPNLSYSDTAIKILSTTNTTSSTSGALQVAGGVGVAGSVNVGTGLSVSGNVNVGTGLSVQSASTLVGQVSILNNTNSTSSTTGALLVAGGVGVAGSVSVGTGLSVSGNVNIGTGLSVQSASTLVGQVSILNNTNSTSSTSGALLVTGGIGVAGSVNVGTGLSVSGSVNIGTGLSVQSSSTLVGAVSILNNTNSTSSTTGALIITGGIGVAGNVNIGTGLGVSGNVNIGTGLSVQSASTLVGQVSILNNTNSTSSTSGAVRIVGGLGVSGNIFSGLGISTSGSFYTRSGTSVTGTAPIYIASGVNLTTPVSGAVEFDGTSLYFTPSTVRKQISNITISASIPSVPAAGDFWWNSEYGSLKIYYNDGSDSYWVDASAVPPILTTQNISVRSTDNSTSSTTGALTILGGLGVSGNVNIGTGLGVSGSVNIGTGLSVQSASTLVGIVSILNNTNSNSSTSGALIISGGVGISGNVNIGTGLSVSGSVNIGTGLSVQSASTLVGAVSILSNTNSTSSTTGALRVAGGVGISGNVTVGIGLSILSTADSSSTSTGALTVSGGVGIGQSVYIGGNFYLNSNAITAYDTGFRNRIINGDFYIDQRNSAASVTPSTTQNVIDRWKMNLFGSGRVTCGLNYGGVASPSPVTSYYGMKVTTTTTPGSSDYNFFSQVIEGPNTIDLQWGTASAQPITLSFWAYSSLTGTFGGSVRNNGTFNRSYPFTYTISSANTWEKKTVVIPGDTTGTWTTSTGFGIELIFIIANGSTYQSAPGSWASGNFHGPSGSLANLIGTLNSILYLTAVQIEIGSVSTPFERRNYGFELFLCQRYYQIVEVRVGGYNTTSSYLRGSAYLNTLMRQATPVITVLSTDESSNLGSLSVDNSNFRADSFRYLVQVTTAGDAYGQWKVSCDTEF